MIKVLQSVCAPLEEYRAAFSVAKLFLGRGNDLLSLEFGDVNVLRSSSHRFFNPNYEFKR